MVRKFVCIKKSFLYLTFSETCPDSFFYNANICILLNYLKLVCSRKQSIIIFSSTCFPFFVIVSKLTFNCMNSCREIIDKTCNELAINLALSINCNMYHIFFVISSPFLSILVTSFSIGTAISVFSRKQVSCFLDSSVNSFMTK